MKTKSVVVLLAFAVCGLLAGSQGVGALSETKLVPTNDIVVEAEDQEFASAMAVWNSHKYGDGEKMLREFAKKNPNSRWAAEAELHRASAYNLRSLRFSEPMNSQPTR
ncbi:MAG: hypothetical protein Q7T82_16210 [Armatimonadota bacterium]|nr:hypothetical protein [Armatimonadota bacterium]